MPVVSRVFRCLTNLANGIYNRTLTLPPEVELSEPLAYGGDPVWQTLEVLRPKRRTGELLPVIVNVHGGAWVAGDREMFRPYCAELARHGFAVVNFSYHLLPEYPYRHALEDACLALQWTVEHAEEYGFDLTRCFAVGDSAGAQILGILLAMQTDERYRARFSCAPPEELRFRAVAMLCGIYELNRGALDAVLVRELLPREGRAQEVEKLSVLQRVNPRFPPVFLSTCSGDFLRKQALPMAEALRRAGVPVEYRFYRGTPLPLLHDFQLFVQNPHAKRCTEEVCAFFRAHAEVAAVPAQR